MAAGLGFKTFTTGEVLTAADTNGYLMQGVLVFASAAARDAAITSPQEGQFAYLKDTNVTMYYTGSAWTNLDTTGMVNPMTTTGDTIYSSSGSTPARLGIGSTGQVLTVAGGVPTWATPSSGGGMTLLSTTTLSGTSTTISSIDQTYVNLFITFERVTQNTTGGYLRMACNSGVTQQYNGVKEGNGTAFVNSGSGYVTPLGTNTPNSGYETFGQITIFNYATTTTNSGKSILSTGATYAAAAGPGPVINTAYYDNAAAISSLYFAYSNGGTISGTIKIYGVK